MTGQGHRRWAFAAGEVPVHSTGEEPEFTSRDELCVLNLGPVRAHVEVTVYHHDRDPVGPYRLEAEAVPLGQPFGLLVESDVPIVVQLHRLDTRQDALSSTIAHAFPLS
jgi:hypothetical protein